MSMLSALHATLGGEHLPGALLQHVPEGDGDATLVTDDILYYVPPLQQLAVGKYVPDEAPTAEAKAEGDDDADDDTCNVATADGEGGGDESPAPPMGPSNLPPTDLNREEMRRVSFVSPVLPSSSAPLFFPIHYPGVTHKDKCDPRGLPLAINTQFHGQDRPAIATCVAKVKACNGNRIPLYKVGPGAVAFRVVLNAIEASGMRYTPHNELFNLLWAKRSSPAILAAMTPYQKINHFPGTWGVGRKDSLHKNVSRMRRQYGADAFNIVPQTWLIPNDLDLVRQDCALATAISGSPPTYIVKPSASSCGKGIFLQQGVPTLPQGMTRQMICQRYVANPMIVHGRKFDLRMYCVVTGFDPLRIYLFDEGLVRFAAEKYPGADKLLENSNAHLTNYSINKVSALAKQSRGKAEDSDDAIDIKWSISDLRAWLKETDGVADGTLTWDTIYERAKDVVVKTFLSIESDVVGKIRGDCATDPTGSRCFELYGLDLMVDDQLEVTLIEANIMPSLATGSTLDKAVKSRMIAHMLTLAGVFAEDRPAAKEEARPPTWYSEDRYYYPVRSGAPAGPPSHTNVPLCSAFGDASAPHSQLTDGERRLLAVVEEEKARSGGFDCIFPAVGTMEGYMPFFSKGMLRSNYVLMSWEKQRDAAVRADKSKID